MSVQEHQILETANDGGLKTRFENNSADVLDLGRGGIP